eukprot:TRINITY_DN20100_c0_g1_i2.p4 TRINITY_DN20100_c0_g1~~TRINITY_DN20100_c0_g1_i2.p4  ORF type:complete len:207 (+),score=-1.41 TRINITY_DN20100_c0_g1_i2:717-1337(+)
MPQINRFFRPSFLLVESVKHTYLNLCLYCSIDITDTAMHYYQLQQQKFQVDIYLVDLFGGILFQYDHLILKQQLFFPTPFEVGLFSNSCSIVCFQNRVSKIVSAIVVFRVFGVLQMRLVDRSTVSGLVTQFPEVNMLTRVWYYAGQGFVSARLIISIFKIQLNEIYPGEYIVLVLSGKFYFFQFLRSCAFLIFLKKNQRGKQLRCS